MFKNQKKLLDHYLFFHSIEANGWFFQKLLQSDNKVFLKNYIRCNQFLATKKEKAVDNFLKRYNEGKNIRFEEKPLDIIRYPAWTIYGIEFKKYNNFILFLILKSVFKNFCKM